MRTKEVALAINGKAAIWCKSVEDPPACDRRGWKPLMDFESGE